MDTFKLRSDFKPAGDQPAAIRALTQGLQEGLRHQTLLGATATGKTFTIANVIAAAQKPTLVIGHNKTLAAQLVQEYRQFFPDSAVHYFVSYYDYYQPEAYMPITDTYIEKEAMVNEEIDRLRHAATQALLTRRDVIVVASVSCIYGLGSPIEYQKSHLKYEAGDALSRATMLRKLISIHYERTTADLSPGTFRALGNAVEIMPANERFIIRIEFLADKIGRIQKIDAISRSFLDELTQIFIFPAKHFITPEDERKRAAEDIKTELSERLAWLEKAGKVLEHERLKRRTNYDLAMIREIGYCNGIENYSRHFDGRSVGEPPWTLIDYFPRFSEKSAKSGAGLGGKSQASRGKPDFLTIIDESHVTVPQLSGMFNGDRARKETLIEHGFRLPSAKDNRPLTFEEFESRVGETIYTSATPGPYELEHSRSTGQAKASRSSGRSPDTSHSEVFSGQVVQQIIRPTGLVDPEVIVRPITGKILSSGDALDVGTWTLDVQVPTSKDKYQGQIADFIAESERVVKKGDRVIATTLTKKMAEDLTDYLKERGIKAEYLHSDIKTIERISILTDFRKGTFDVLVGVNLLREGLDLPEVSFIGILDADKEGFLRSDTALIQIIGRAARNVSGRVILYADVMTGSMQRAIDETNRRREIQQAYNKTHGITPQTIKKQIKDITDEMRSEHQKTVSALLMVDRALYIENPKKLIREKERQMAEAVKTLDFETAAILRDEIKELRTL